MANKDFPSGLRIYDEGSGARPRLTPYKVAVSTTIYAGAPLVRVADGTVAMTASVNNVDDWVGVAAHPIVSDASNIQTVMVWDDPGQKFIIQTDSATTLAATDVGLNASFVNPNTNITGQRYSNCELDGATAVATFANLEPLRILALHDRIDNDWDQHADVVVQFNPGAHAYGVSLGL